MWTLLYVAAPLADIFMLRLNGLHVNVQERKLGKRFK